MASDAEAHGECEEPAVEREEGELLLTERLDEPQTHTAGAIHSDDDANEIGDEDDCVEQDGSDTQQICWNAVRASSNVTPTEESAVLAQPARQQSGIEPQRRRKLVNSKEQQQIQSLTRKLSQYKKLNGELHGQLHAFYKNEAVAQLENRNKERQLQIEQLLHENRVLSHQQRLLSKQIEELQDSKDNFPLKKHALQEELRVCKEKLRQHKDKHKDVDEKAFKTHQQVVDLATKNKALVERVKKLEAAAAASLPPSGSTGCIPVSPAFGGSSSSLLGTESIIASQEDEITRLQQRVALMKKTQRAEKLKQERQLKANSDEIEQTRVQLEAFYQQLFAKEKTIRSLFLQMKKLKRAVQELTNAQQTNQHMQQMVFGRDVRYSNHNHSPSSPHNHNQSHRHSTGHTNHTSSTPSLPFGTAVAKKVATERIHDTLRQLGYIPSFASPGKPSGVSKRDLGDVERSERRASGGGGGGGRVEEHGDGEEEELPANVVQGKLIPCPPPSSIERSVVRSGTPTARTQFYTSASTSSPPQSRENAQASSLEIGLDSEGNRGYTGREGLRSEASDDFGISRAFEESDVDEEEEEEEKKADRYRGEEGESVLRISGAGEYDEEQAADASEDTAAAGEEEGEDDEVG